MKIRVQYPRTSLATVAAATAGQATVSKADEFRSRLDNRVITPQAKRADLEGTFRDLGKKASGGGPPPLPPQAKKQRLVSRLFKKKGPPPLPPHMNPLFAKRDGWIKRLGNKTKSLLKGVAVVGVGVLLLYSFILWNRMYQRIKYLKQHQKPEPPFVDPVAYLMDAWPRMPIPRPLAEKAVDRFIKSKQFRQTGEVLSKKQQSGLADRLRQRASSMPNKKLTDQQLAQRAQGLSKILERESEGSGAGGRMTASDLGYLTAKRGDTMLATGDFLPETYKLTNVAQALKQRIKSALDHPSEQAGPALFNIGKTLAIPMVREFAFIETFLSIVTKDLVVARLSKRVGYLAKHPLPAGYSNKLDYLAAIWPTGNWSKKHQKLVFKNVVDGQYFRSLDYTLQSQLQKKLQAIAYAAPPITMTVADHFLFIEKIVEEGEQQGFILTNVKDMLVRPFKVAYQEINFWGNAFKG